MAEFSWAAAGDVGLGLLGGLTKGLGSLGASAVAKANAESAALIREGRNTLGRANAGLASTIRGINNNRMLEAAADVRESLLTNAIRTGDAFTNSRFEDSIRSAEAWGAATVRAGAAGLGGAGIDAISRTTSLQLSRQRQALEDRGKQQVDSAAGRIAGIMPRALVGLASGPLDARQSYAANQITRAPDVAGALIGGLLGKRDSLSTLMGSLYSSDTPGATVTPIESTGAPGTPLPGASFEWAQTSPVGQSTVTGTDLPAYYPTQAEVRSVDNTTSL